MPHPIVEIDELVRLVVDYLVEISPRSVVSFALTCRSLEEPTLSSLWRRQYLLIPLLRVLPQFTKKGRGYVVSGCNSPLGFTPYRFSQMVDNPRPKEWDRFQRFASWMRYLSLDSRVHDIALQRLSNESPGGLLCPNLERLDWEIRTAHTPRSFHIFLSPSLKRVSLFVPEQLQYAGEIVSRLPSSLEHFSLTCSPRKDGEPLKDLMSSFVLRCGPSLRSFGCRPPLSEAAFHYLMQLPNLRSWIAFQPPQAFPPPTFPSLEELHLEPTALPWLHLLAACGQGKRSLAPASTIMNTNVKETLKVLTCPRKTAVDPTLLSSMSSFRNLVSIVVLNRSCHSNCLFDLTDNDVEDLAAGLPSLVDLRLGEACGSATCRTTVSSLLLISTRCLELKFLEIHFNTHHIVGDMERLLNEGTGHGKPRCKLQRLSVGYLLLQVPEFANETLAVGFADIFPCLEVFSSRRGGEAWRRVGAKLQNRLTRGLQPFLHSTAH